MTWARAFYDTRINAERAKRNHLRQLEALGYKVTSNPPPESARIQTISATLIGSGQRPDAAARLLTVDFRIRMRS
jgi:hypothetical protein